MNHENSGLAHGTGGSPQLTLENGEMAAKAKDNEKKAQERYEYLRCELPKTSPIPIPNSASIKDEHKKTVMNR